MAKTQDDARQALFDGITRVCGEIDEWNPLQQSEILRNLAAAFRHVSGGPQPGGSVVETKS